MPLTPDNVPEPGTRSLPREDAGAAAEPSGGRGDARNRLFSIFFATFALLVGLVLVVLPWRDTWNLNYIQGLAPALQNVWDDPYFRGAVTGLGVVNIYLACLEVSRLRKRP